VRLVRESAGPPVRVGSERNDAPDRNRGCAKEGRARWEKMWLHQNGRKQRGAFFFPDLRGRNRRIIRAMGPFGRPSTGRLIVSGECLVLAPCRRTKNPEGTDFPFLPWGERLLTREPRAADWGRQGVSPCLVFFGKSKRRTIIFCTREM